MMMHEHSPSISPPTPGSPKPELPMSAEELQDPFLLKRLPTETRDPLVYALALLGCTVGVTWGMGVMLVDDFARLTSATGAVGAATGNNVFEYRFAATYKFTCFLFGLVCVVLGSRLGFRSRILGSLTLQGGTVVAMMWLLTRNTHAPPAWMFVLVVALAGAGQAFSQGSLSGLCATCPERYTRAFVVGLGCSAVVVGMLKLIAKLAVSDPGLCERIWLWELVCLYVAGIFMYLRVVDTDVTIKVCAELARDGYDSGAQTPLMPVRGGDGTCAGCCQIRGPYSPMRTAAVVRTIWPWLAMMVMNWAVSMTVFPGMTADLDSSSPRFQASGWYDVLIMFVFFTGDVVGRSLTIWPALRNVSMGSMVGLTSVRCLLVPLFLLMNKYDTYYWTMDVSCFLAVAVTAITNGYAVSICSLVPPAVVDVSQREVAGTLCFLFYIMGQCLGVCIGWFMKMRGFVPEFF